MAEVGLNSIGIIIGLEVSRLARRSSDWYRLIELCSFTETLIGDEDGLYNPSHYNDRLLLGLKGTMSEAELQHLRCRLDGGRLNKAMREELAIALSIGYIRDKQGEIEKDPDEQVRGTMELVFEKFGEFGSACRVVRYLQALDMGV